MPPIALRVMNDVVFDPRKPARINFDFPHEFEILAGGTAGDGISFFSELEVTANPSAEGATVSLERMFVQFDHLGGLRLRTSRSAGSKCGPCRFRASIAA